MVRLNELDLPVLKTAFKTKWNYPQELTDYLLTNKYLCYGSGAFSQVWGKPNENIVIKVNLKTADDMWPAFAEFCQKTRNPHFPRIGKMRRMRDDRGNEFIIAIMEKLKPLSDEQKEAYRHNYPMLAAMIKMFNFSWAKFSLDRYPGISKVAGFERERVVNDLYEKFQQTDPSMYVALKMLKALNLPAHFDLHTGNVMMRGNTMVINDPFGDIKGNTDLI